MVFVCLTVGLLIPSMLSASQPAWALKNFVCPSTANEVFSKFHISCVLIIKPTRCTNFSNLFLEYNSIHVSDSSSVHHQEFFTVHTAMVYVSKLVWHIPFLCAQWKTPDDGQRHCPKHVEFYSKNKFEK